MDEEKVLYYYKIFVNHLGYIYAFNAVPEGEEYDYYGQLGDFPGMMESTPEGWYKFNKGEITLDRERRAEVLRQREEDAKKPTWYDTIESQVFYTAMETDTLIEE